MKPAVLINGGFQEYKPRFVIPEDSNLYYIRRESGGYNPGIKGNPKHEKLDALSNCVSYAIGRFNEIGQYGECRYLRPVNAERFIQYAGGLEVSQKPALGACAVWKGGSGFDGSDGAGHVAIVEQINSDGSIITSESGWGDPRAFWITHRKKGNSANWGQKVSQYQFLGFILNPAVAELPKGVEWVKVKVIRRSGQSGFVNLPGVRIADRWFIHLRSLDALGAAKVSYNSLEGYPELII